jgi:beta-aspartyl-peptidase (threonine type)
VTEREKKRLEDVLAKEPAAASALPRPTGTVGAIARDAHGRIAAGTSTGGTTAQMVGRVGDSAIPGTSTFADDRVGALSTTGHGETIVRVGLGHVIAEALRRGATAEEAVGLGFARMAEDGGGRGGVILVTAKGEAITAFTTACMALAWEIGGERHAEVMVNPAPGELVVRDCRA